MPEATIGCGNRHKYKMAPSELFTRWWLGMPAGPVMPQKDRDDAVLEALSSLAAHGSHAVGVSKGMRG